METLLKFRWLIALILITGFLIYYNERKPVTGIPSEMVDSLLKWNNQNNELKLKFALSEQARINLELQLSDELAKGERIVSNNKAYKVNYQSLKSNEKDEVYRSIFR